MITILRGTSGNLIRYVAREYTTPKDFIILGSKEFALPFLLVRLVMPVLRKRLGNEQVEGMLRVHKLSFSLIFNKLTEALSLEEQGEQTLLTARLSSNITHSRVAKDAILKVYARALLDMKERYDFRLIIPDTTHLDTGSLDLLLYLYQVFPDSAPDLVIGYDPAWKKPVTEPDTGISWYYALDSDTVLRGFVYAFEAAATETKDINSTGGIDITGNKADRESPGIEWAERLDTFDDGLELKAFALAATAPQQLDDNQKALMLEGIHRCFRLYDFTNALLLSLRSLAALGPVISNSEKATLYHIMALSAHNRHFFSQGNQALAAFIDHALQKALLYETDPATSVAILYRLIVTHGRRKEAPGEAYAFLERAYQLLKGSSFDHKELLTAWINNIHSFLLMKQGKIKEAIAAHEEGFYLLDALTVTGPPAIKNEIAFTKAVLAENLSTLNALSGNFKQMKIWYAIESKLSEQWPALHAVPSAEWQSFHYQNLELGKALEKTQQGLAKARNSFHYVLEYFFTISAADIHYRMGDAANALVYFEKALIFQGRIGYEYASVHTLRIYLIKTKLRLNRIEEALVDLAEMKKEPVEVAMEPIEICLVSAYVHSLAGAVAKAEAEINTAIDLAIADGDCGTLVKVMLWAGLVCQQLNRTEDALAAYLQALEISRTVLDGIPYQPDTADLAEVYFGLYECSKENTGYLDQAIDNLSLSLKGNADSWWCLSPILDAFSRLPPGKRESYLKKNKPALDRIRKAARQRKDCRPYLNTLKLSSTKKLTPQ
ncbi:tetratricopeptide repeat protein [Taibaiella helva]|uniref:hypothetical protein n=1 Tax=Taibaiella helva TaxID=2301235 RepID=UPI000E56DC54|nr:hypothetical protein [Taibaiella helva]